MVKEYPAKQYYNLTAKRTGEPVETIDRVLQVSWLKVNDSFRSRPFVYRINDVEFRSDYYAQLFNYPDRRISALLRRWLADSGRFVSVVPPGSLTDNQWVLEGAVDRFYADLSDLERPSVVISWQLRLIDNTTVRREILLTLQAENREPIDSARPEDIVRGWNRALTDLLRRAEDELIAIEP